MSSLAQPDGAGIRVRDVTVSEDELTVALMDGRTIAVPLAWYPRLAEATPEQRAHWEMAGAGFGIHWPELDEDISTQGLLAGARAPRGSAIWRSSSHSCSARAGQMPLNLDMHLGFWHDPVCQRF